MSKEYRVAAVAAVPFRLLHDLYAHMIDERGWSLQSVSEVGDFEYIVTESIGSSSDALDYAVRACTAGTLNAASAFIVRERTDAGTSEFTVRGRLEMELLNRVASATYTTRYSAGGEDTVHADVRITLSTSLALLEPLLDSLTTMVEAILARKQAAIHETLENIYNTHYAEA